ncbi:hypothetical protein Tco_0657411 [Tanacetum coccineum]|uniref:Uncharacterized protein n=1 Tax=Tanacetum coccineum TaxID=301880 RepID=A0ABQ4XBH3_9ASTR
MMRINEVHKFSDGTLMRIRDKLDFMVKDFKLFKFYKGMETRKWIDDDKRRSEDFIEDHLKMEMEMEIHSSSNVKLITECSYTTYTFYEVMKDLIKVSKLPQTLISYISSQVHKCKTLQDDEKKVDLADDLMKAQVHNQRQVKLKRLFKPDTDDELWKFQKHIHEVTWRLYDSCGVHHVSTEKGIDIYMLVEKEYPLSRGTLTLMLVAKHCGSR